MSDPTDFPPLSAEPANSTRMFNVPPIVLGFVGVLTLVHLVVILFPPEARWVIIEHLGVRPTVYKEVLSGGHALTWGSVGTLGAPLLAYAFLHGSLTHLGFNALWLIAIGTPVARRLGGIRFIAFFFVTSILGVVAYIGLRLSSDIPVVGASGGISGLMGGLGRLMFAPKSYDPMTKRVAGLMDRRVLTFAAVLTITNVIFAFGGIDVATTGAAVAWQVHIAGFAAGLLLYGFFDNGRSRNWPPLYKPRQ